MIDRISYRFLFLLPCLLMLTGCWSGSAQTARVSGRVTLDGRPLAGASVSFQPTASGNPNPGPGSFGTTDANGRFQLQTIQPRKEGAIVGLHIVRISRTLPGKRVAGEEDFRPRDPSLPPQADDGSLRFTVPPIGTEAADFALSSKPAARP